VVIGTAVPEVAVLLCASAIVELAARQAAASTRYDFMLRLH
jgi:hypothetical protein